MPFISARFGNVVTSGNFVSVRLADNGLTGVIFFLQGLSLPVRQLVQDVCLQSHAHIGVGLFFFVREIAKRFAVVVFQDTSLGFYS